MIYELVIEDEKIDEVFAISLVESPAIESNFIYFDKEEIRFAAVSDDKRLVMGPILIPDKKIIRVDGAGMPYHVFFKPETIKRLSEMYLQKKYTDKATLEHDEKINGVNLVESWIVESRVKDKSAVYGLSMPVGTWMGTFKIDNDEIWNDYVKEGKVKGFSIEGLFGHNLVAATSHAYILEKDIEDLTIDEADVLLSLIKDTVKFESYTDYGQEIRNNAKRGIELNENNNNKCATQTGKVRAQQLADGEAISVDTIKRMYSYLSRAETYYDETDMNACGTISYLLWGGKSALSWSRNKLKELGLLEEGEAQPSITSTYPGTAASGSIAPALLAEQCPPATQHIGINLYNRQTAINQAHYGPLNPNEPNEEYWKAKADQFGSSIEEAKKALCGNCAFFYRTPQILECIAGGIEAKGIDDPFAAIDAGEIGYCEAFDFKCAASRTCDAWVVGGPITQ
jgi:hypothetical protein